MRHEQRAHARRGAVGPRLASPGDAHGHDVGPTSSAARRRPRGRALRPVPTPGQAIATSTTPSSAGGRHASPSQARSATAGTALRAVDDRAAATHARRAATEGTASDVDRARATRQAVSVGRRRRDRDHGSADGRQGHAQASASGPQAAGSQPSARRPSQRQTGASARVASASGREGTPERWRRRGEPASGTGRRGSSGRDVPVDGLARRTASASRLVQDASRRSEVRLRSPRLASVRGAQRACGARRLQRVHQQHRDASSARPRRAPA